MPETERTLQRAVLWQNLQTPGTEYCRLWQRPDGWALEGTVILALGDRPFQVGYDIFCDPAWATRRVEVVLVEGADERRLQLVVDDAQHWWQDGREIPAFRGCWDVDLGVTPATNSLPIRRLALAVGQNRDVTAAWVRFPDLSVQPLPQRYTRLAEDRYRYESNNGGFTADLVVDELGLVQHYANGWEQIASR